LGQAQAAAVTYLVTGLLLMRVEVGEVDSVQLEQLHRVLLPIWVSVDSLTAVANCCRLLGDLAVVAVQVVLLFQALVVEVVVEPCLLRPAERSLLQVP
jgi:hypothetical protein